MPLQNRVTPFGELVATPARGTLMGNRGIIHDPATRGLLSRRWQHQAWICCVLEFKGHQHPIMGPSAYTELFFLDECTALAAGHRPCAYCRRRDYDRFKRAWLAANRPQAQGFVPVREIDRQLHRERVGPRRSKRTYRESLDGLPDGVLVAMQGVACLVRGEDLHPWTAHGYAARSARPRGVSVEVLTPPSTVAALRHGYRPTPHPGLG